DAFVVRRDRIAVFRQPLVATTNTDFLFQRTLESGGQIDLQGLGLVEQFGVDAEVGGALEITSAIFLRAHVMLPQYGCALNMRIEDAHVNGYGRWQVKKAARRRPFRRF